MLFSFFLPIAVIAKSSKTHCQNSILSSLYESTMGEKKSIFSKPFFFYSLVIIMYLYLSLNVVSIRTGSINTGVMSNAYAQTTNPFNTNTKVFQQSDPTIPSMPATTTDLAFSSLSQSGTQILQMQQSQQQLSPSIPDLASSS